MKKIETMYRRIDKIQQVLEIICILYVKFKVFLILAMYEKRMKFHNLCHNCALVN